MVSLRKKALVKTNIELWLNDLLLTDGLYTNVATGETDVYGRNISRLAASTDASFIDGSVFQSPFKNWVHESDISPTESGLAPPIIPSGVTVDGTFYPQATGAPGFSAAFGHSFDFPNGRVIFDTLIVGSVVESAFSYKTIAVDFANNFNNELQPLLIETAYKDNPSATGVDVYPSAESRTLPSIFIDIDDRQSSPYELGTRNAITDFFGVFHIWSRDDFTLDLVEDILGDEHRQVLLGVDFNTAPFPLVAFGDKNPAFPGYKSLARLHGAHFWRRIYIEETRPKKDKPLYDIERGMVEFNIRVYPNF